MSWARLRTSPFLTLYTPTYKRPQALGRCLASVAAQTIVEDIQQIVVPDHVGVGVHGMYAHLPYYVDAVYGQYVHVLADDDELYSPHVVQLLRAFAAANDFPDVILVRVRKNGQEYPLGPAVPPVQGQIDLGCVVTRNDVWKQHVRDYGQRYEGDFDHVQALYQAGHRFVVSNLLFLIGDVRHGAPEPNFASIGADVPGGGAL